MITVLSPATVSNVVCGFDTLGFALGEPCDLMVIREIDEPEVRIFHRDNFGLPLDADKNVAGVALKAFRQAARLSTGFQIEITKIIKPGSGIGSSAASACGAVVAANELTGAGFSRLELVEIAMAGEMIASGARHADNLAPCIFGGFTLVRSTDPLDIVSLDFEPLFATVIHPQIEIKTSQAREMLPKDIPLTEAVKNWSNLGAFVAALARGDHDLLARSMVDTIVEPVRGRLIPGFDDLKRVSLEAGAIGGGISGSGPSVFMLSATTETGHKVGDAMRQIYDGTGLDFNIHVSAINPAGVRVVEMNANPEVPNRIKTV